MHSINDPATKLSVKIAATKKVLSPGESVTLHVEIRNEGKEGIFVAKSIDTYGSDNGHLTLLLYNGPEADGPTDVGVGDFSPKRGDKPPLAGELVKYWVPISPGYFYGSDVVMEPNAYKHLLVPGKYLINGSYHTSGFFVPDDFGNPLYAYMDELRRLPYRAWTGDVETNSIWIVVASPEKGNRKRPKP